MSKDELPNGYELAEALETILGEERWGVLENYIMEYHSGVDTEESDAFTEAVRKQSAKDLADTHWDFFHGSGTPTLQVFLHRTYTPDGDGDEPQHSIPLQELLEALVEEIDAYAPRAATIRKYLMEAVATIDARQDDEEAT